MQIGINKKRENIDSGDLVYSKLLDSYGFIGCINKNYYFIDKNNFDNWSDPYEELNELIENVKLELIAKNKDLIIHMQTR